ncbi:hypothetical protein ACMHYB_36425 [Sorangium sp. So ce1128]
MQYQARNASDEAHRRAHRLAAAGTDERLTPSGYLFPSEALIRGDFQRLTPCGWRKYRPSMRFVGQSVWICLILGVAIGFPSSVRAEEPYPGPGKSDGSTVKDHLRRAERARARGRWAEAVAAYKAAFEATAPTSATKSERAEIAGELGLCELALRKYRDAAEHLAWSLEQGLDQYDALSSAQYERFSEGLRKAAPFVGTLIVAVDPPDAEVIVDGTPRGRTARTHRLFLDPGRHVVRARATGRKETLHVIRAVAGGEHEIATVLPRAAASGAKKTAPAKPKPASTAPAARAEAPTVRAVRAPAPIRRDAARGATA